MTEENDLKRRRPRGSAWHWKQTDCWYYTQPETKRRKRLLDENGRPIRGKENRQAAELALARVKVVGQWRPVADTKPEGEWTVAKACSEYLEYCERSVNRGAISKEYRAEAVRYLNLLCEYCGVMPVRELKRAHVEHWIESQTTWRSPATKRNVIAIVLAAFNRMEEMYDVPNPLRGLKKPLAQPRLHSLSPEDEQTLYDATDEAFRKFLFATIHTGLRPFCELARVTADDVEETERGMMWRVYSSKTKKTRKIPVRREVAEMTRRLTENAPRGSGLPLFQNTKGGAWTKVNGVSRFLRLKKKLGWDQIPAKCVFSCYSARHTFAHRMLSGYWNDGQGCSIETLAELLGDSIKVAFDHYGREWSQYYHEPLWRAIGVSDGS